jgi:hypothetical protein
MKSAPAIETQTAALSGRSFDASFPSPDIDVVEIVDVKNGSLLWRPQIVAVRTEREIQRLLWEFVKLADSSDETIETFARKWGPLGLCEKHHAALCHDAIYDQPESKPALRQMPDLFFAPICPPSIERKGVYSEPIEHWRRYSRRAGALVRVAGHVRLGQTAAPTDWQILTGSDGPENPFVRLGGAFNLWAWLSDLRPTVAVHPRTGTLQLCLVSHSANFLPDLQGRLGHAVGFRGGLFGALATHLLLATTGGAGLAFCSNPDCRTLYRPSRIPAAGKLHFCKDCGAKAARRLAKRRERGA